MYNNLQLRDVVRVWCWLCITGSDDAIFSRPIVLTSNAATTTCSELLICRVVYNLQYNSKFQYRSIQLISLNYTCTWMSIGICQFTSTHNWIGWLLYTPAVCSFRQHRNKFTTQTQVVQLFLPSWLDAAILVVVSQLMITGRTCRLAQPISKKNM